MPTNVRFQVDPATGGTIIPVHSKRYPGSAIIVDAADVAFVVANRWSVSMVQKPDTAAERRKFYAIRKDRVDGRNRTVYLHRALLGVTDRRIQVDHENQNGLDCRRENMRIATRQQNAQNRRGNVGTSSRFKGVCWHKRYGKWQASITHNNRQIYLGLFADEIDAAMAYDAKARELFGDFACLNFADDQDARKDAA